MKKGTLIIVVVVLLAICVGAAYWAYQRPAQVVNAAVEDLSQADSKDFTATVELANAEAAQQLLGGQGQVKVVLDGTYHIPAEGKPSLASKVMVTAEGEGVTVNIEGEMRFIEDKVYLHITKAPSSIPLLAQLKQTWIELPRGGEGEVAASQLQGEIFSRVEAGPTETIDGVTVKKYEAIATEVAIVQMLDGIASLLGTQLTADQIANLQQSLQQVKELPVTLWITPWTHELRRVQTVLQGTNNTRIQYIITFAPPSEDIAIEPPEDARPLNELIQSTS